MRNIIVFALLAFLLFSCTPGPSYFAKDETDTVKKSYNDKKVQTLFDKNSKLFKDIYASYSSDNVGMYQDGIGITVLEDFNKEQLHYVMVYIRPREASFDINATKPEERIAATIRNLVPKYIKTVKSRDLDADDIEGLAFGIYWAVRDHSQCDTYGGHIEYVYIFFPKSTAQNYLDGKIGLAEAIDQSEVMASTELKTAKAIRPVF